MSEQKQYGCLFFVFAFEIVLHEVNVKKYSPHSRYNSVWWHTHTPIKSIHQTTGINKLIATLLRWPKHHSLAHTASAYVPELTLSETQKFHCQNTSKHTDSTYYLANSHDTNNHELLVTFKKQSGRKSLEPRAFLWATLHPCSSPSTLFTHREKQHGNPPVVLFVLKIDPSSLLYLSPFNALKGKCLQFPWDEKNQLLVLWKLMWLPGGTQKQNPW